MEKVFPSISNARLSKFIDSVLLYLKFCLPSHQCAIRLESSVLLVGGYNNGDIAEVTEYSPAGFVKEWPTLNTPRHGAGCGRLDEVKKPKKANHLNMQLIRFLLCKKIPENVFDFLQTLFDTIAAFNCCEWSWRYCRSPALPWPSLGGPDWTAPLCWTHSAHGGSQQ